MSDWQPIETAPKDGTWFWGLVDGDLISMVWHPKFEAFVSAWRRMSWVGGVDEDHSPTVHYPEYWTALELPYEMSRPTPLPDPPEATP